MNEKDKRVGFVGIIIKDRKKQSLAVNQVLMEFGDMIIARTGIPYHARTVSVITLIVDATTDDVGSLTGKLGRIPGVSVRSALSKE